MLFCIFHSHAFSLFGTHFITSFSPWPSDPLAWHWGAWGCKVVQLMRKIKAVCIFLNVCVRARGFPLLKRFTLAPCVGRTGWLKSSLSQWHLLSSLLFCHCLDSCPPRSLALRLSLRNPRHFAAQRELIYEGRREWWSREEKEESVRKWVDEEEEAEGRTG